MTIIFEEIATQDCVANIGSPAGVIHDFPLTFAGCVQQLTCALGSEAPILEGRIFQLYMAYAQEIWQRTAARNQGNNFVDSSGNSGSGLLDLGGREAVNLQVTITNDPHQKRYTDGSPPIVDCGWVCFQVNDGLMQIEKITFYKQIFFPPTTGCNKIQFFLHPGCTADFHVILKDYLGVPLQTVSGNFINASTNTWGGFASPGPNLGPIGSIVLETLDVPAQDTFEDLLSHTLINVPYVLDGITHWNNRGWRVGLLAYLVETWQNMCAPDATNVSGANHTLQGPYNLMDSDYPYVVSSYFQVLNNPPSNEMNFGQTGLKMYGYVVSLHNGFAGKLQYLNAANCWVAPSGPDATGWSVILKPGAIGLATIWGKMQRCQGLNTSAGTISLADGDHAGLNI